MTEIVSKRRARTVKAEILMYVLPIVAVRKR